MLDGALWNDSNFHIIFEKENMLQGKSDFVNFNVKWTSIFF